MKLGRVFCFLILFGISAIAAEAQTPVDPTVLVIKKDPAGCNGLGQPLCYSGTPSPLVEAFSSLPLSFEYDGSGNLNSLLLELTGVPNGTPLYCQTDIWQFCSFTVSSDPGHPGDFDVTFDLFDVTPGVPGPCANDGVHAIAPTCPGFLAPGDGFGVSLLPYIGVTPEPGSMLLFGTGLLMFGIVLRRRVGARLSRE
jgi:PEP-CTERM motif